MMIFNATANKWSEQNIGNLTQQRILITGANSGIGFETARILAERGAEIILACRNQGKAQAAIDRIKQTAPQATLHFLPLDLADQNSIQTAVKAFQKQFFSLDRLINNAGVMWLPQSTTPQGFEMQFGTNHLGHFALTGLLLDTLLKTPNSRIITLSSIAHKSGNINFQDIHLKQSYRRHKAYAQSKLANLIFAYELQRRLSAAKANILSVAVHPGVTNSNLVIPAFEKAGMKSFSHWAKSIIPKVTQNTLNGALPALYACTEDTIQGGDYIGPDGLFQLYGTPKKVKSTKRSHDRNIASKLWALSESLTQVSYNALKFNGLWT